jgi:hypothetical protein
VLALVSGVVYAATAFKPVTHDIEIISATPAPGLAYYIDEACTQPMPLPVHYGQVERGKGTTFTYYLKNSGDTTYNLSLVADNVTWGSIGVSPSVVAGFAPGAVVVVTETISVSADAPVSLQTFNVYPSGE